MMKTTIDGTFAQRVKRNPAEALIEAEEIISLAPENANAWYLKGVALSELNRHEEALKSFDQAVRLRPDLPEAWQGKGSSLLQLQQYEKALAALQKVPRTYLVSYQRGYALWSLGRHNEAMDALQEAVRLNTDDKAVMDHSRSLLQDIAKRREAPKAGEDTAKHREAAKVSEDTAKRQKAAKVNEDVGTASTDHASPHTYNSPT